MPTSWHFCLLDQFVALHLLQSRFCESVLLGFLVDPGIAVNIVIFDKNKSRLSLFYRSVVLMIAAFTINMSYVLCRVAFFANS